MIRGALVVFAVVVLASLASVQAVISVMFNGRDPDHPHDVPRDWMRARLDEEDRRAADIRASSHHFRSSSSSHPQRSGSGLSSAVARSIADQIDRTELASVPIPYTKQFYLTFGPYYVENPMSINEKKIGRQFDEIDASWIIG